MQVHVHLFSLTYFLSISSHNPPPLSLIHTWVDKKSVSLASPSAFLKEALHCPAGIKNKIKTCNCIHFYFIYRPVGSCAVSAVLGLE